MEGITKKDSAQALSFSPIKGPEGNIEFLAYLLPAARATHSVTPEEAELVVRQAHAELDAREERKAEGENA